MRASSPKRLSHGSEALYQSWSLYGRCYWSHRGRNRGMRRRWSLRPYQGSSTEQSNEVYLAWRKGTSFEWHQRREGHYGTPHLVYTLSLFHSRSRLVCRCWSKWSQSTQAANPPYNGTLWLGMCSHDQSPCLHSIYWIQMCPPCPESPACYLVCSSSSQGFSSLP